MASARVQEAIQKAQLAVMADKNNDFPMAVSLYQEAVNLIRKELESLPADANARKELESFAAQYQQRVMHLHGLLTPKTKTEPKNRQGFVEPVFEVPFDPSQPDPAKLRILDSPPVGPARTFWLMRVLTATMADNGAFLTPKMYIPAQVWTQQGMKITAVEAKVACCGFVVSSSNQLKQIPFSDHTQLAQGLQTFLEDAVFHQNTLSRYLSFIEEQAVPKVGRFDKLRSLGNSLTKTAVRLGTVPTKVQNSDKYVQLLIDVFRESQIFGVWLLQCEAQESNTTATLIVRPLLERISSFLYQVVCAFVLNDLSTLLDRYLKKSRQTFTRVLL